MQFCSFYSRDAINGCGQQKQLTYLQGQLCKCVFEMDSVRRCASYDLDVHTYKICFTIIS